MHGLAWMVVLYWGIVVVMPGDGYIAIALAHMQMVILAGLSVYLCVSVSVDSLLCN